MFGEQRDGSNSIDEIMDVMATVIGANHYALLSDDKKAIVDKVKELTQEIETFAADAVYNADLCRALLGVLMLSRPERTLMDALSSRI